ncbi:MAG TPA: IclR family transcriptional regulator [Gaiellaceae bacterium]|nr:IclR family transcriptional regulator [Gaiellaceae bacterium]
MARTGQPSRERVASLGRSLAVLDALAEGGELGTNELARRVGATASTVSRQLGTLVEAGIVEHVAENGRYRLGIRLVELANTVLQRLDVRTVARPHLEALAGAVGETATLSVPGDPDAVTVDFVRSQQYVQGNTTVGRPSVAHATAAGKVMLAFTGRRPRPPLRAYTERTIVDPAALDAELERVLRRGFAEAFEEREPDLNAIAAPVWGSEGLAGIVAVHGPVRRFGRAAARKALPLLLEQAAAISRELGATRS